MNKKELDLAILSFHGSQGIYGYLIVDKKNIGKAVGMIDNEKNENDEYSIDTCAKRLEKLGIKLYSFEEQYIDFGM